MAASRVSRLASIETLILDLLPRLEPAPGPPGRGRPPVVPLALIWGALLLTVLGGSPSQRAVWHTIAGGGLRGYPALPVSDEAIRQRLLAIQPDAMRAAFATITAALREDLVGDTALASAFPGGVFALDATTLDKVARPFGHGQERPLAGRLHTLYDVRRQLFHALVLTDQPHQNERVAAPDLLAQVPAASLVLMDRGYTAYPAFDALTTAGQAFITRLSDNASYTVRHTLTATATVTDEVIWLGAYRADQAAHSYRLVTIPTATGPRRYLTNVLEPQVVSPAEIATCYRRRWDIERAFKTLKRDLGLAWIWSRQWAMIELQIWATLLIAQISSALRQEVARRARVPVEEVSLELLLRTMPLLALGQEGDLVEWLARSGAQWGLIRPVRRVRDPVPTSLPWTPLPPELPRTRTPRYARKP